MIAFAYTECGLSIEQFFQLSWYEWSLEIEKVKRSRKRDQQKWESDAMLVREQMALLANVNRNPKKRSEPYKGSDFFRLSFDDPEEEGKNKVQPLTPEEVVAKFKTYTKELKHGK